MAYTHTNSKGQTYHLHYKDVVLQNGREQRIYYFAKQPRPGATLDDVPAGYIIMENERTGLPFCKKAK